MYDTYGDVIVTSNRETLVAKMVARTRNVFLRSPFYEKERVPVLEWISPFPQKPFSSKFLHIQNGYTLYGDLRECYYSPRYSNQRLKLRSFFERLKVEKEVLGIVGSGIGPFTVYLAKCFAKIVTYEENPHAVRYAGINTALNLSLSEVVENRGSYETQFHEFLLAVVPSESLKFHLNYHFGKMLIFYVNLASSQEARFFEVLKERYAPAVLNFKPVRSYSKDQRIHRVLLSRVDLNQQLLDLLK